MPSKPISRSLQVFYYIDMYGKVETDIARLNQPSKANMAIGIPVYICVIIED